MARPVKHDLKYFSLDVNFFENHKVILVEEDYGVKGGYLAVRLMAMVYEKGYYLEWKDKSEFSCAKRVGNGYTGALVGEILKSCLKNGLFNKELFENYRILTSVGIQERWIQVMKDLRRKIEVDQKFWLISSEETTSPEAETLSPAAETTTPSAESTVKEMKGNEIKVKEKKSVVPAKPPPEKVIKGKTETEPFWQELVDIWFNFNQENFGDKPTFADADPKYLKKIILKLKKRAADKKISWTEKTGPTRFKEFLKLAYADPWLGKHFILKNLNEQFDRFALDQMNKGKKVELPASDLQYLYETFLEGSLNKKLVKSEHFDQVSKSYPLTDVHLEEAKRRRIQQLMGSNQGPDIRLCQDYQSGKKTDIIKADEEVIIRIAKKLALMEYFNALKNNNQKNIQDGIKKLHAIGA